MTEGVTMYPLYTEVMKSKHTCLVNLKQLLDEGHSPDEVPRNCSLPNLYHAIRLGKPRTALMLIQHGCQVTMPLDKEQLHFPIIILAARCKMTEVVFRLCLDPKVNIFVKDRNMNTIVHEAVATKNLTLLTYLPFIVRKCPKRFLSMRNAKGLTPLHLAVDMHGDLQILKALFNFDCDCGEDDHFVDRSWEYVDPLRMVLEKLAPAHVNTNSVHPIFNLSDMEAQHQYFQKMNDMQIPVKELIEERSRRNSLRRNSSSADEEERNMKNSASTEKLCKSGTNEPACAEILGKQSVEVQRIAETENQTDEKKCDHFENARSVMKEEGTGEGKDELGDKTDGLGVAKEQSRTLRTIRFQIGMEDISIGMADEETTESLSEQEQEEEFGKCMHKIQTLSVNEVEEVEKEVEVDDDVKSENSQDDNEEETWKRLYNDDGEKEKNKKKEDDNGLKTQNSQENEEEESLTLELLFEVGEEEESKLPFDEKKRKEKEADHLKRERAEGVGEKEKPQSLKKRGIEEEEDGLQRELVERVGKMEIQPWKDKGREEVEEDEESKDVFDEEAVSTKTHVHEPTNVQPRRLRYATFFISKSDLDLQSYEERETLPVVESVEEISDSDSGGWCNGDDIDFNSPENSHVRAIFYISSDDNLPLSYWSRSVTPKDSLASREKLFLLAHQDQTEHRERQRKKREEVSDARNDDDADFFGSPNLKELINQKVMGSKETMLHYAAKGGHMKVMGFLLRHGADVNARDMMNNTPLHLLVMEQTQSDEGYLKAVEMLLKAGADPNLKGTYKVLSFFRRICAHPDHREMTVGALAAVKDYVFLLKLLAAYGARFDLTNFLGWTPLVLALKNDSCHAAMYLAKEHPESSERHTWMDRDGHTTMHFVARLRHEVAGSIATLLLKQGYTYESPPLPTGVSTCGLSEAYSPLTWAIYHQKTEVIKALLAHDPALILRANSETHRNRNPLLVSIRMFDEAPFLSFRVLDGYEYHHYSKELVPILNLMLSHGADFETMVRIFYAQEKVYWMPAEKNSEKKVPRAVPELVKRLGATFLYGLDPHAPRLWGLQDLCLRMVRGAVRGRKGDYNGGISSLPLPDSLKDALFHGTVNWARHDIDWLEERYVYDETT